jgi:hypothetical protein
MKKTTQTITRDVYEEKCKYCPKIIKANSESAVEYKMKLHVEKHEKEKK